MLLEVNMLPNYNYKAKKDIMCDKYGVQEDICMTY